jgi:hypothetical protein
MDLTGLTFKTTIYESVVGQIIIENYILSDGTIDTSTWVRYPDGVSEEVFSVLEAVEKLEL